VTEVYEQDVEMFQTAALHATVDFNKLEVVLVIISFDQDLYVD